MPNCLQDLVVVSLFLFDFFKGQSWPSLCSTVTAVFTYSPVFSLSDFLLLLTSFPCFIDKLTYMNGKKIEEIILFL